VELVEITTVGKHHLDFLILYCLYVNSMQKIRFQNKISVWNFILMGLDQSVSSGSYIMKKNKQGPGTQMSRVWQPKRGSLLVTADKSVLCQWFSPENAVIAWEEMIGELVQK
jgi:hypothetical protein